MSAGGSVTEGSVAVAKAATMGRTSNPIQGNARRQGQVADDAQSATETSRGIGADTGMKEGKLSGPSVWACCAIDQSA